jgi:hypothetical protein
MPINLIEAVKMSNEVEYLCVFLDEDNGEWISVHLYACKKHKHLFTIPEDESRRSPKQEADLVVLKAGDCPNWNCW